ncbi:alpha/beta fold hydrolase [Herbaspirillum sp. RU 5E]|uniref:alpha/beta fold hydrolase n=1 Tax=Herbaspirillum sp. CAH-3 TaxID=2605746 RepID=UPI0012AC918E|nr:alpha/beta fold hydrolase [Herbaspirillum sp. CAH-3]MBW9335871.1 alpha/beta fold hydrolase [Herbaspirillum sp. RU 5E]MRT31747.1 alpha/beta fold hydrolase [Herbaspirillum sp. CAH-3]
MTTSPASHTRHPAQEPAACGPGCVPLFWPMMLATEVFRQGQDVVDKHLRFLEEEAKLHALHHPQMATANRVRLALRTLSLREYGKPGAAHAVPTLVVAPYAGHTSVIADYYQGQSLVETLLEHGVPHVFLTDWHSASEDMKDLEIDNYLADLCVVIDELGGRANLVGLCQGGWISAMIAARFPHKVQRLVLAGSPIDAGAGDGPLKQMVDRTPIRFYEDLVRTGGGLMRGSFMLQGWKNMHPDEHYFTEHVDLFQHIDDPVYLAKRETFAAWYETPIDLPGRWYLQAIRQIFKDNLLARGQYVALGKTLDLRDITCPLYLLAGERDDITTPEQVLNAAQLVGTAPGHITQRVVPGGHIGLFMGGRTLAEAWPQIAQWLCAPLKTSG